MNCFSKSSTGSKSGYVACKICTHYLDSPYESLRTGVEARVL
jgi:hypothetical protein